VRLPRQGMIHISELSWDVVMTPESVVQQGTPVRCAVLDVNVPKARISLSLKRMQVRCASSMMPVLRRRDCLVISISQLAKYVCCVAPAIFATTGVSVPTHTGFRLRASLHQFCVMSLSCVVHRPNHGVTPCDHARAMFW